MLGKKVRVFWPLDEQWYVGVVRQYDPTTGEHLLTYPDGDTEWVRIGDTQANLGVSGDGDVQSPPRILSKIGALSAPSADSPQSRRTEDQGPPGSGNKDQPPPLGYPLATAYPPYPGHLYPGGMAHPYSPVSNAFYGFAEISGCYIPLLNCAAL